MIMEIAYRPNANVKTYLTSLMSLLNYANSRNDGSWAFHNAADEPKGVYGHAYRTVKAILIVELGCDIANRAMDQINYGGYGSQIEDLMAAVNKALNDTIRGDIVSHNS